MSTKLPQLARNLPPCGPERQGRPAPTWPCPRRAGRGPSSRPGGPGPSVPGVAAADCEATQPGPCPARARHSWMKPKPHPRNWSTLCAESPIIHLTSRSDWNSLRAHSLSRDRVTETAVLASPGAPFDVPPASPHHRLERGFAWAKSCWLSHPLLASTMTAEPRSPAWARYCLGSSSKR